jgi:hypothetical protein
MQGQGRSSIIRTFAGVSTIDEAPSQPPGIGM